MNRARPSVRELSTFQVHLATDCTVYKDDVEALFAPGAGSTRGGACEQHSVMLLIPIRLGVDKVNPIYIGNIKYLLSMQQTMGIIGGKPRHSLYFVGYQGGVGVACLVGVQVMCAPHCCLSMGCRWCVLLTVVSLWGAGGVCSSLSCVGYRWCVLLTVLCGVQVVCAPHCLVWGTGGVCSSLSCVGCRWCVLLTVLCGVQVVCAPHCLVWGAGGVRSSLSVHVACRG